MPTSCAQNEGYEMYLCQNAKEQVLMLQLLSVYGGHTTLSCVAHGSTYTMD